MSLVVRGGVLAGAGPVDLRIDGERIVEVGTDVVAGPGDDVVDAAGGAVLPGLHDHHVHLRAMAAAADSIGAGPPDVRTVEQLASRLQTAAAARPGGSWVRAVGYHESVAGDLDRWALDRLTGVADVPVRVQHRSGAQWILNSAAIRALGLEEVEAPPGVERDGDGRATGRIWREDRWLADRLPRPSIDFRTIGAGAAALGVTGFTDATPDQSPEDLAALVEAGEAGAIPQRLHLMAPVGAAPLAASKVTLGPVKVLLDDVDLPPLDNLVALIRAAHQESRAVAVHCVTLAQATWATAAFGEAGSTGGTEPDRIEHGAVLSPALIELIRALRLTVVTQPGFVAARGDQYLVDVDPEDQAGLWLAQSLLDAGVSLAAGSDAPFGPADPWLSMRAAAERRTAAGEVLGPAERLRPAAALALWTGRSDDPSRSRTIGPGQPADICVLAEPAPPAPVLATIVAGKVIYRAS